MFTNFKSNTTCRTCNHNNFIFNHFKFLHILILVYLFYTKPIAPIIIPTSNAMVGMMNATMNTSL